MKAPSRILAAELTGGGTWTGSSLEGLSALLRTRGIAGEVRAVAFGSNHAVAFVSAGKVRFP